MSWPNGDETADSRSKQSKRSSKRSLHERNGVWMDWNTPVISSSDGDGSIILIFQASTRSIGWSATIVAANAGQEVLVSRKVVLWIESHKKADADVDDEESLIACQPE